MFYGTPLKKATLRLRNNTSFRAGETVLVALQKYKKRTRTLIDLVRMRDWMNFLLRGENKDLLEMYIGVESRFLPDNKESYSFTRNDDFLPIPQKQIYEKYSENPHRFVAEAFRDTFNFLLNKLPDIKVITPEYFPPTYWYFQRKSGTFETWDRGNLIDQNVIALLESMLIASATGAESAKRNINTLLKLEINQGIINAAKFHNFKATSYYIEGVSHKFTYGSEATTSLSLNFGQDSLVLLEPKSFLPIGFISLEKKMRIGYDDGENGYQRELWQEYEGKETSAIQKMYTNQFIEDRKYKRASFLHRSQANRNSSNYMYEIVNIIDPINTSVLNYSEQPEPVPTITPPFDLGSPYVDQERRETKIIDANSLSRTVNLEDGTVIIHYPNGTSVTEELSSEERARAEGFLAYEAAKPGIVEFILKDATDRDKENFAALLNVYESNAFSAGGNPDIIEVVKFMGEAARESGAITEDGVVGTANFSPMVIEDIISLERNMVPNDGAGESRE